MEHKNQSIKNNQINKVQGQEDISIISSILNNFSGDQCFVLAGKYLTKDIINVFKDDDFKECIDVLIKTNLNVNEASKQLFMHRNTLLNRIEKIESMTGLNLKKFEDAVTLLVLENLYEKTKDLL